MTTHSATWLIVALLLTGCDRRSDRQAPDIADLRRSYASLEKPRLVGAFELTTHAGVRFTQRDFLGSPHLVFAGYTSCPDVCPNTLGVLRRTIELARRRGQLDFGVVFVSVDPVRDSVPQLERYVRHFHPRIIGLTGKVREIDHLVQGLGAAYRERTEPSGLTLFDHSTSVFVVDASARVVGTILHPSDPEQVLKDLTSAVGDPGHSGPVSVERAWIRSSFSGARMLAGFATLVNRSDDRISLTGVESEAFGRVHTHGTVLEAGMAKMRALSAVEVPANGSVELKPGGLHLMLIEPKRDLSTVQSVPMVFRFSDGSRTKLTVPLAENAPRG